MNLINIGMDEHLATHFAHLFIRDPLVIFQETLDEPPEDKSDHFEVRRQRTTETPKLICHNFMILEPPIHKLATHAV